MLAPGKYEADATLLAEAGAWMGKSMRVEVAVSGGRGEGACLSKLFNIFFYKKWHECVFTFGGEVE